MSAYSAAKPPSILIYTGGQDGLYTKIREQLRHLLPDDVYTVFHLYPDVLKNEPWMEPNVACLIVADTKGFNEEIKECLEFFVKENGKLLMFRQGKLLRDLENLGGRDIEANFLTYIALGANAGRHMKDLKELTLAFKGSHEAFKDSFTEEVDGNRIKVELKGRHGGPITLSIVKLDSDGVCIISDANHHDILHNEAMLCEYLSHCDIRIHRHEKTLLTSGVMMAQDGALLQELDEFPLNKPIGSHPKLFFMNPNEENKMVTASSDLLPVMMGHTDPAHYHSFDCRRFFSKLRTKHLGRVCLHVPVATCTMDIADSLQQAVPQLRNAVVIASQQTQGRGRGATEYISPPGAAMFTVYLDISSESALFRHIPFIQHIFAVALVDAVHELIGDENFPLRIKWPNDFYCGREQKIGVMLVKGAQASRFTDDKTISIGAAINVSNSHPTTCLNNMVPPGKDFKFHVEDVIACTLNKFEHWLEVYERDVSDHKAFMEEYYKYWLHNEEEVYVKAIEERMKIVGLDDNGFLECRGRNRTYSVSNDGNSFDMTKGLIHMMG